MKIVVNDANILIDFCKLDLLAEFFHLAFDFQVVDAIWEELQAAANKLHELSNRVNPKLGLPKNELDAKMKSWTQ